MTNMVDLTTAIPEGRFHSITHNIIQWIAGRLSAQWRSTPINKPVFNVLLGVIFVLLMLVGMAANRLFGIIQVDQQVFSVFVLGVIYIYILCIVVEYLIENFLKTIRDDLLDSLVSEEDRKRLQESVTTIFSVRRQFWFGFMFSVFVHAAFIALDPSLVVRFGIGFIIVNVIFHAFHGFCVYFYVAYLQWAVSDLKNYRYDLFELDPSSTAIIPKLATLLQSTISVMTL